MIDSNRNNTGISYFSPAIAAEPLSPAFRPTANPARMVASTPVNAPIVSTEISYSDAIRRDHSDQRTRRSEERNNFNSLLLFSLFAENNADNQNQLSAGGISGFITMLEEAGINVEPIKKLVESVSGKSYEAFAATENSNTHYDVSLFERDTALNATRNAENYSGNPSRNPGFDSARAIRISQTDNAGSGYCGRGTANILRGLGVRGVVDANGTDWDENLSRDRNWVRLRGVSPHNAPVGAVLTYDSDLERGRSSRGTGGGTYGHVEIVAENRSGDRVYVSDAARRNAGGTVRDNYSGAFLYVGPGAPSSNLQIAANINSPTQSPASPSLALT